VARASPFDTAYENEHAAAALALLAGRERDDPGTAALALAQLTLNRLMGGDGADLTAMERAIDLERRASHVPLWDAPSVTVTTVLTLAGRLDDALAGLRAAVARAAREGQEGPVPSLLAQVAAVEMHLGRLDDAAETLREGSDRAAEAGVEISALASYGAQLAVLRGRFAEARAVAGPRLAAAEAAGDQWKAALFHRPLAWAAQLSGDDAAAVAHLRAIRATALEYRVDEPAWFRYHPDLVESLVRLDRPLEAAEGLAELEAAAARTGFGWTTVTAARCRGLVLAGQGDLPGARAAVAVGLAAAQTLPMPLERGRTLLVAGWLARRAGARKEARGLLEQARAVFDAIGTPPWSARAAGELARVSGRTGGGTVLTAAEEAVAALAAEGRTNREIAAALVLSVRTVESHLSAVYRKLGVGTRAQLAAIRRS
jgi:DNA-binding CsgD family transcriptional regulator